ncbi:MAG: lytic transglycosylase domain-containing protein [Alphaproteobacteria bacterium]
MAALCSGGLLSAAIGLAVVAQLAQPARADMGATNMGNTDTGTTDMGEDGAARRLHLGAMAAAALSTEQTAALPANASSPPSAESESDEVKLPAILDATDTALYRAAFTHQASGNWAAADKAIARLGDKRLVGHLLAERYLDPKYRPKYEELVAWLRRHGDHPDAQALYRLALKRKPKGTKIAPMRPSGGMIEMAARGGEALTADKKPADKKPVELDRAPDDDDGLAGDEVSSEDNSALLLESGRAIEALAIAERTVARKGLSEGSAHFSAGLAAWRLGLYQRAADHFEATATSLAVSAQTRAAGAYWAARAHLAGERPEKVASWQRVAARYPYTFYGLLAQRALNIPSGFDWTRPTLTEAGVKLLAAETSGARAFALIEIGERVRAEREFRQIRPDSAESARALLALALRAELPALAMAMGRYIEKLEGQRYDSAFYPIPHFRPDSGFIVDRALLFAVMRHESGFNTAAVSRAGARGLMQIMPRTASYLTQDGALARKERDRLYHPEFNLGLGQKYLAYLLDLGSVQGNLSSMLAAYNAGPGNLAKWQRTIAHGDDPLLYIEAIPVRETRNFVRHVLTSYWIYRARLDQDAPSLDAIAVGRWPLYTPLDEKLGVRNVRN